MAAAKLTPLGVAVLELLHEKPMHPYEMAQLMRERHVSNRTKIKAGSLYHTVERLQDNGFIEIVDTQRDGRRPERTVYGMTGSGRDAFVERTRDMLGTPAEEYPEYLSGLAVISQLGPEISLAELGRRALHLEAATAADKVVVEKLGADRIPEVFWLDVRYTAAARMFELSWIRELIADIESGRVPFQDCAADHPKLTLAPEDNRDAKAS